MAEQKPIRVGVIGLGFMGATHIAAYQAAAKDGFSVELAAVADRRATRRAGELWDVGGNAVSDVSARQLAFDPQRVRGYVTSDELLADDSIDLVSICTQTDKHVDVAVRALQAGKHVIVEKPVALQPADIRRLQAAHASAKSRAGARLICMPAHAIRFWPAWRWVRDRIVDQKYGRCLSASFQRMGAAPSWSAGFYSDPSRSGGAIVDLHIHDADFVRFCFGDPAAVSSVGTTRDGGVNQVVTTYHFTNGPTCVTAEGAWLTPPFAFRMRYIVQFEHATVDYDLARDPALVVNTGGDTPEAVSVEALSGYDLELRHAIECIASGRQPEVTLADAIAVADLLDAERRSVATRQRIENTASRG